MAVYTYESTLTYQSVIEYDGVYTPTPTAADHLGAPDLRRHHPRTRKKRLIEPIHAPPHVVPEQKAPASEPKPVAEAPKPATTAAIEAISAAAAAAVVHPALPERSVLDPAPVSAPEQAIRAAGHAEIDAVVAATREEVEARVKLVARLARDDEELMAILLNLEAVG